MTVNTAKRTLHSFFLAQTFLKYLFFLWNKKLSVKSYLDDYQFTVNIIIMYIDILHMNVFDMGDRCGVYITNDIILKQIEQQNSKW